MAFEPDSYDKNFTKQVNWLLLTKDEHKLIKRADDLVKKLELPGKNLLSAIRTGTRHVPKDLRPAITKKMDELIMLANKRVLHPTTNLILNEPGAAYNTGAGIKALAEQMKILQANLETVLANQRILMAHLSVDAVLAAERYAGSDRKLLNAELQKRDKLIGAALVKAS